MMEREGVIKYQLQHSLAQLPSNALWEVETLSLWQKRLKLLGMVGGGDPQRYQGLGFGNLSARISANHGMESSNCFVITGSQTGHLNDLGSKDFAWVTQFSVMNNTLISRGPTPPSSESLTHAMIYEICPLVHYVFHVHCPFIWNQYESLGLPQTDPKYAYGTQGMAWAIKEKIETHGLVQFGILSMGGHTDGVIAFGDSATLIGDQLCILHRRASCLS